MIIFPPWRRVSRVMSDYALTIIQHSPLSTDSLYPCLDFSSCMRPFHILPQPHHVTASHRSPSVIPPDGWRTVRKNPGTKQQRSHRIQLSTYVPGLSTPSYLSCILPQPPPLFFCYPVKAKFTPSIQLNLDLSRSLLPLTSVLNTLLAMRCSSILSMYPNHLNTLVHSTRQPLLKCPNHLSTLVHSTRQPLLKFSSSMHFFLYNFINSCRSNQIAQTLHLKIIHYSKHPSFHLSHHTIHIHVKWPWRYYTTLSQSNINRKLLILIFIPTETHTQYYRT